MARLWWLWSALLMNFEQNLPWSPLVCFTFRCWQGSVSEKCYPGLEASAGRYQWGRLSLLFLVVFFISFPQELCLHQPLNWFLVVMLEEKHSFQNSNMRTTSWTTVTAQWGVFVHRVILIGQHLKKKNFQNLNMRITNWITVTTRWGIFVHRVTGQHWKKRKKRNHTNSTD